MAQPRSTSHNIRYATNLQLGKMGDTLATELRAWLKNVPHSELVATCAACRHSKKTGPMFCKKYNIVPPVKVIVGDVYCEAYSDEDDIPF